MLQKEKYQLAKEQEIIAKQFEQQRIKAAEVGKLTRAYETNAHTLNSIEMSRNVESQVE